MNRLLTYLILLIVTSVVTGCGSDFNPNIKIDPSITVDKTELVPKNKNFYSNTIVDSWRQSINDTIIYTFSYRSEGGISFLIKIFDEQVIPEIEVWSDYEEFDGQHKATVSLKGYFLSLNSIHQNIGDTLMGEITIATEPIKYFKQDPIYLLKGTFFHIRKE
ncbi:MAG: hypothetical protein HRT73_11355 [Flavobacteriales bacterium]|nr:hypothetical protein [Flavobacteriales bacterium]